MTAMPGPSTPTFCTDFSTQVSENQYKNLGVRR